MANNYYSMRSYNHFCFFSQINNSKKKKDEFAFFIFFTFKGWKRLLVADGPRQVVNGLVLYAVAKSADFSTDVNKYYEGNIFTAVMLLTMIFTVVVFALSSVMLVIACIMYLPLICYIKGNLKEYCCHKIDKRITELVQRKKKQRLGKYAAIARAEAAGDFSHLMNKKGIIVGQKMAQPTLPDIDVDVLDNDAKKGGHALQRYDSGTSSRYHQQGMRGEKALYGMGEGDDYSSSANLLANQGYAGSTLVGHAMPGTNLSFSSGTLNPSMPPTAHNSPDSYPVQVKGMNGLNGLNGNAELQRGKFNDMMSQMGPIGTSPNLFAQRQVGRVGAPSPMPPQDSTDQAIGYGKNGYAGNEPISPGFGTQRIANSASSRSPLAPLQSRPAHQMGYSEAYEMDQYGGNNTAYDFNARQTDQSALPMTDEAPVDMSAYAPYDGDGYGSGAAEYELATTVQHPTDHLAVRQEGHAEPRGLRTPESRTLSRHQSFAFGDVYDAYLEEDGAEYGEYDHGEAQRSARASNYSNGCTPSMQRQYDGYGADDVNQETRYGGQNNYAGGADIGVAHGAPDGFYYGSQVPQHNYRETRSSSSNGHADRPYQSGFSGQSWGASSYGANGTPFGYESTRGSSYAR